MSVQQKITQSSKKVAQATAQQVRQESLELLRSTQRQVLPQVESRPQPDRAGTASQVAARAAESPVPAQEIKQQEQAKLQQLRSRLAQMQEEESMKARQSVQQEQRQWNEAQTQLLHPQNENQDRSPVAMPTSKRRQGMMQGAKKAKNAMTQKLSNLMKGGETRGNRSKD